VNGRREYQKEHKDRDAAWLEVTKQLDRVIAKLK